MSLRQQRPGLTTRTESAKRQVVNGSDGSMSLVRTQKHFFRIDIREVYLNLIPEKKILPSAVLLVAAIYAAVAAIFYFE